MSGNLGEGVGGSAEGSGSVETGSVLGSIGAGDSIGFD